MGDECDYDDVGEPVPYAELDQVQMEIRMFRIWITEEVIKNQRVSARWSVFTMLWSTSFAVWSVYLLLHGESQMWYGTLLILQAILGVVAYHQWRSARSRLQAERDELEKLKR